ncbi:MAG: endonuclease/exonuclease/phosphatase [Sphingobacteriales bacterium]|nr:MAG: endonuclease/exonuclease/phosphatase [Sphingobacteriales bacterium]TAF79607.1 MAG: endonuclease/exonuclease/phosphatase [Sphingobacteriales bacterium]
MKKNKNTPFTKLLLTINWLIILLLFLCYSATVINPAKFWYISYFGLAYPFVLAINIISIIVWMCRKRWYFLYSLLAIMVGFYPLKRTINYTSAKNNILKVDSHTIKLMTYNTGAFQSKKNVPKTVTKSQILHLINDEQPDILGIQEFYTRSKGVFNIKDSVLKILHTQYYDYPFEHQSEYESYGIALFSKYPIINKGTIVFEDFNSGNRTEWIEVQKGASKFRVYAVHLASIKFQPEDYEFIDEVQKDLDTKTDVLSTKRIIKRLKIAFVKRSKQVTELKAHLAKCSLPYIVMGDFNDTPCSYTLAQMSNGLKNAFEQKGSGMAITYNGDFPNFQIDYILASPHFDFKGYKIIKKKYSDHYPIISNVTFSPIYH